MKHTKNEYKRKIKELNYNELREEYNDINKEIMKSRQLRANFQNPYEKENGINVKLLKWKRGILIQELHQKTK